MARDTDRKKISEAIRLGSLWRFQTQGDLALPSRRGGPNYLAQNGVKTL